jgi:hypothetical protein
MADIKLTLGDEGMSYEREADQISDLLESPKTPKAFKRCLEDSIVETLTRLGYMRIEDGQIRLSPAAVRLLWSDMRMTDGQCGGAAFPLLIQNIAHHLLTEEQGEVVFSIMGRSADA